MTENSQTPVQTIWQNQPVEGIQMSAEMIRKRAGKFERRVYWRNVREYASSAVAICMFGFFLVRDHRTLPRIAYVLFIAGIVWAVLQLHRKGSVKTMPAALGASPSLAFFRGELERQRDAVKSVLSWYLAPLIPGFLVLTLDIVRRLPFPASLGSIALMDGGVALLFFVIWRINLRAARCLQRKIDELKAVEQ
jgi:hypothetical protein